MSSGAPPKTKRIPILDQDRYLGKAVKASQLDESHEELEAFFKKEKRERIVWLETLDQDGVLKALEKKKRIIDGLNLQELL